MPIGTPPAATIRSTTVAVYGRPPPLEDLRRARRRDPARAEVVLQRDGHAGQRPRIVAARRPRRRRRRRRRRASSRDHEVERVDLGLARARSTARCSSTTSRAERSPARTAAAISTRGHGASPRIRGTRNRPSSAAGACASTSSRSRPGRDVVGPEHVHQRQRMRGRRHAVEVERGDVGGVVEDRAELAGELLDLVVGEREAGQRRDVLDVGPGDARAITHARESTDRSPELSAAFGPRARAVVAERVVALAHGLAEPDLLRAGHEVEALLRVARDAVEERARASGSRPAPCSRPSGCRAASASGAG